MKFCASADANLLEAISAHAPEASKSSVRSWIKEGRITLDGDIVKNASIAVRKGQEIALTNKPKYIPNDIKILYQDQHLVVIEKPAGLLSVATDFEKEKTAHGILKDYYRPKRVFVVHRLDQDTSGVMLFAFTESARDALKETFEKHAIERVYYAIVGGRLDPSEGTWESYLYEDERYHVRSTEDTVKGQLATTHYKVAAISPRDSALYVTLETGRKNQIRVHCQDAGHPILGDKKYGASKNPIKRLCLHAHILAFTHPITKQKMRFESPIPPDFEKVVRR